MRKTRCFGKGKKAFIAGMASDIWWFFIFVLVIAVFWVFFKWSSEAKMQQIQDKQDISYGNYLAQVYLRTPVDVGGKDMTVAELISFYDYNQTLDLQKDKTLAGVFEDKVLFIFGKDNAMRQALVQITEDFVEDGFDEDKCYLFAVSGTSFSINYKSDNCAGAAAFDMKYLLSYLKDVPVSAYTTYIAPVDPRDEPIMVFAIYDFERLLSVYAPDQFFDMDDARRMSLAVFCRTSTANIPVDLRDECRELGVSVMGG
jgi:hypothetical protein